MSLNPSKTDPLLKRLNPSLDHSRLAGLEARVWQRLADETHPDPILHSALLLRGSALAIVLILGGIVGATTSTAQASTSLHAFSSAPAYSIMKLVQN